MTKEQTLLSGFKSETKGITSQDRILDQSLLSPIKKFLSRPKKGIRADLVKAGADWVAKESVNEKDKAALGFVLEALHAGSLIVDDIQDGSPVRRDEPSLHILLGVPKALNAGNFLYFWALREVGTTSLTNAKKNLIRELIIETLFEGHIGQAMDLGCLPSKEDPREIGAITYATINYKTGALMSLAMKVGAIAGGANSDELKVVDELGRELGYLLQAYDDLKNYKFNSTDIRINLDEKRFEDFRNERPGFIWAFAADYTGETGYQALVDATKSFPELKKLIAWMREYNFHDRSVILLKEREEALKKRINSLSKENGKNPETLKFIAKLIERIKDAYRDA